MERDYYRALKAYLFKDLPQCSDLIHISRARVAIQITACNFVDFLRLCFTFFNSSSKCLPIFVVYNYQITKC